MSEVRGGCREELPQAPKPEARGGGLKDLPHTPTPEAKGGGREEQPHIQGAVAACPFSSCLQSLPASESFPVSQLFA